MTATARAPSTTHSESVAVRMVRVTWYRHRGALAGIAALFAVAVIVLLAEGLTMRHTLGGLSRCLVTDAHGSVCAGTSAWDGFGIRPYYVDDLSQGLNVLPLLAAMFAGVPWLTREFETGSFRYTWVQGIGRRDWLGGTVSPRGGPPWQAWSTTGGTRSPSGRPRRFPTAAGAGCRSAWCRRYSSPGPCSAWHSPCSSRCWSGAPSRPWRRARPASSPSTSQSTGSSATGC